LYGHELDEDTDPVEAGVGFVLRRDGVSDFIGATGLAARLRGPRRECVGFRLTERGVPRQGYPVIAGDGRVVGRVSSGSYSPVIDAGIGLALVDAHENLYHASNGCGWIEIRGKRAAIRFAKPPIHKA
jgi:aminomethyltransferase